MHEQDRGYRTCHEITQRARVKHICEGAPKGHHLCSKQQGGSLRLGALGCVGLSRDGPGITGFGNDLSAFSHVA